MIELQERQRATGLVLPFADGTYAFHLPMAQIEAIERQCGDKSIVDLANELAKETGLAEPKPHRLLYGPVKLGNVATIIHRALIGGGRGEVAGELVTVDAERAAWLVATYVHERPLAETAPLAWAILNAAIIGND